MNKPLTLLTLALFCVGVGLGWFIIEGVTLLVLSLQDRQRKRQRKSE